MIELRQYSSDSPKCHDFFSCFNLRLQSAEKIEEKPKDKVRFSEKVAQLGFSAKLVSKCTRGEHVLLRLKERKKSMERKKSKLLPLH